LTEAHSDAIFSCYLRAGVSETVSEWPDLKSTMGRPPIRCEGKRSCLPFGKESSLCSPGHFGLSTCFSPLLFLAGLHPGEYFSLSA
jgi:hypothetical protein